MPSVRVRRQYSPLQDPTEQEPRSLAAIFSPGQPEPRPVSVVLPDSPAIPQQQPGASNDASPTRQRARGLSRVSRHCLSQSFRNSDVPRVEDRERDQRVRERRSHGSMNSPRTRSPNRLAVHDGMVAIEGSQVDVWVHSDGEPGRIGSALSVHSDGQQPEDDHHQDDIVEHLDVIDAQVATVSNLTNAANAILIPPLSFYSRKPVMILPSAPREPMDLEKGRPPKEYEDSLDRHVGDVLKRPSKFKRTMQGVWSFLKTPMGVNFFPFLSSSQ
jgi:hypothetical protein